MSTRCAAALTAASDDAPRSTTTRTAYDSYCRVMELTASNTAADTIAIARDSRGGLNGPAAVVFNAIAFHVETARASDAPLASAVESGSAALSGPSDAHAINATQNSRFWSRSSGRVSFRDFMDLSGENRPAVPDRLEERRVGIVSNYSLV